MYRWKLGMWTFVLQRISGLALVVYLCMHVYVTSLLVQGQSSFNGAMEILQNPLVKMGEIALLGAVLFHGLNGVRLLLVDTGWGVKRHKAIFMAVGVFFIVGMIFGGIPLLPEF